MSCTKRSSPFQLLMQQLMLFMIVFSNKLIISGSKVNVSTYYITEPDLFTGGDFVTECNIMNLGASGNLTGCPSVNSPRLTDDVTGEGSPPLNTDQFVGWDRQNQDTFIIAPEFDSDVPPRQVDIYFHNNPAMGIGLPPIAQVRIGYTSPHDTIGPILFTYANNQHLIQSSSNTTMISVVITTDYTEEGIPLPFSLFQIVFDFASTCINQVLISEIKVFTESVNITNTEITFLPVAGDLDLGRDNLVSSVQVSCTVANDGQFSWSWTGPNGAVLDPSHTSVLMADLTLTGILKIDNFSLSDAGQYTCTASMFDGSVANPETARSSTINISAEGIVSTNDSLTTAAGQNVSMICDFSGYLPGVYTITWTGPQGAFLTTNGQHVIVSSDGLGQSQSGGDSPGPSVLSTLTISNVEEVDSGIYTCLMIGTNNAQLMGGMELIVTSPTSEEMPSASEISTTSVMKTPSDMPTSSDMLTARQTPMASKTFITIKISTLSETSKTSEIPIASETPAASSQSVLIATIVVVLLGIGLLISLSIVGLFLMRLHIGIQKQRPKSLEDDPSDVLDDKLQPGVHQNLELKTADGPAVSMETQSP